MNLESIEEKHESKNVCVKYSLNKLAFDIRMRREWFLSDFSKKQMTEYISRVPSMK